MDGKNSILKTTLRWLYFGRIAVFRQQIATNFYKPESDMTKHLKPRL
jgi:hypothetical protein